MANMPRRHKLRRRHCLTSPCHEVRATTKDFEMIEALLNDAPMLQHLILSVLQIYNVTKNRKFCNPSPPLKMHSHGYNIEKHCEYHQNVSHNTLPE